MAEALVSYLAGLFNQELDQNLQTAVDEMAARWIGVKKELETEITLLATELANPPGGLPELDPLTQQVKIYLEAGYPTAKIEKMLYSQGILHIPDVTPKAPVKEWQLARLQRYARLLAQIEAELEKYNVKSAAPIIEQLQNDAAYSAIKNGLALIDAELSLSGGDVVNTTFDRLPVEAVQNVVAIARAGQPLNTLLKAAYPAAASGITRLLVNGTALGWNPRKTAREALNQGLAQGLNHILLVARDQQIRAYREASRQTYEKASMVESYTRLAAKNARTCPACLALDGTEYPTNVLMALHPQDRCTMRPNVRGLPRVTGISGKDWFERQPEEIQKRILGKGKWQAWKDGKFRFEQLATVKDNPTWGPSAQVTSLEELLRGGGGFTLPKIPRPAPPAPRPRPAKPAPPPVPGFVTAPQPPASPLPQLDHDELLKLNLHQLGPGWGEQNPDWKKQSYGGVIFDDQGRVLLRKPKGDFGGYAWTFPKGRMDAADEHPVMAALREVEQECGHSGGIIGLVPGQYKAGRGSTTNNFFLMKSNGFDASKMDWETEDLTWVTWDEAQALIKQGTNKAGVKRDLDILNAAVLAYGDLETGFKSNDYLFKTPPKTAVITNIPPALVADLEAKTPVSDKHPAKKAVLNIKQNGKGVAVLDNDGQPLALASYEDTGDSYVVLDGLWGAKLGNIKTALINAGKIAAKQKKGLYISDLPGGVLGQNIIKAAKGLGFEPGGPGKHHPGGFYLPPEWIGDWKKAPTKFKKPALPPVASPPASKYSRATVTPADLLGLEGEALATISDKLAQKGVKGAIDKIKGGQHGFIYRDPGGAFRGIISFEDQGGIIKVGSAGFVDFDANLQALRDVVKIAKQKGKDFVSYAPAGPILDQYKAWGFDVNQDYGNGASMILKKHNFDDWLKDPAAYGKAKPAPVPSTPSSASSAPRISSSGWKAPVKPGPVPDPIPQARPLPEPADFPEDPEALRVVKRLGGSTGAELVEDNQGRQFVRKRGASADHVIEECHADAAYQAAGANVPNFRLYWVNGKPVKLAEFIEGDSLGDVLRQGGARATKARKEAQKLFATDALFANWDVAGAGFDNMLVDKKGNIWRIDNGGSFRFRAQGARKTGDEWNEYATELWTLRDKAINAQTSDVFGQADFYDLADQIVELKKRRKAILESVPVEVQDVLDRRLGHLHDLAVTAQAMKPDDVISGYADEFSKIRMDIRKTGLAEKMPRAMGIENYETLGADTLYRDKRVPTSQVYDEEGRRFDRLRGSGSLVGDLRNLVQSLGGDYRLISEWASDQAGSSWSLKAQALKYHVVTNVMKKAESVFWWAQGKDKARQAYKQTAKNERSYDVTFKALHAFTQEMLWKMDFPNKNDDGTVTVFRTEDDIIQKAYGVKPGDKGVTMPRGAMDSTSIFGAVYIGTGELTRQRIPFHRVMGTYFMERTPGYGDGMFLGDSENEFVAILGDLPFDYVATDRGHTVLIPPK